MAKDVDLVSSCNLFLVLINCLVKLYCTNDIILELMYCAQNSACDGEVGFL